MEPATPARSTAAENDNLRKSIDTAILSAVPRQRPRAPQSGRYTLDGYAWERKRFELLPYPHAERRAVAEALGVSQRTIERYEIEGPPTWYELALEGLAARLKKGKDSKGKKQKA